MQRKEKKVAERKKLKTNNVCFTFVTYASVHVSFIQATSVNWKKQPPVKLIRFYERNDRISFDFNKSWRFHIQWTWNAAWSYRLRFPRAFFHPARNDLHVRSSKLEAATSVQIGKRQTAFDMHKSRPKSIREPIVFQILGRFKPVSSSWEERIKKMFFV